MSENDSSMKQRPSVWRWQMRRKQSIDELNSPVEETENKKLNKVCDSKDAVCEEDSDDSTLFEEFSTDVIPASFSTLNTKTNMGVLKTIPRQEQAEILEEIESISSDMTDSLLISPRMLPSVENSQNTKLNVQKSDICYELRNASKRKKDHLDLQCKRRKQQHETQVTTCTQPIKRTCKTYIDTDTLLEKLKNSHKFSVKDRKRMISWIRRGISDIREETESMIHGMTPVPNKLYIQMQLKKSKKLCDHLTLLYEEFPSNSQKMLVEEVQQVRENVESELKGILKLFSNLESARRFEHPENADNSRHPPSFLCTGESYTDIQQKHEKEYMTHHREQTQNASQTIQESVNENAYSSKEETLSAVKQVTSTEFTDSSNSAEHVMIFSSLKCSTENENKLSSKNNSHHLRTKKKVRFNIENYQQGMDEQHSDTNHLHQSHDTKLNDINISIGKTSLNPEKPISRNSFQQTGGHSPSTLPNFSQISNKKTQNSLISNGIPESISNTQSKQTYIALQKQYLPNCSLSQIQNYAQISHGDKNTLNTSPNPVYLIFVNENKNPYISSKKIPPGTNNCRQEATNSQLSYIPTQDVYDSEQSPSLLNNNSLQVVPTTNGQAFAQSSINLNENKSSELLNYQSLQPSISQSGIPSINQNLSIPKKPILYPQVGRQNELLNLNDPINDKQSINSIQTTQSSQMLDQYASSSFLNINKDSHSSNPTLICQSQNNPLPVNSSTRTEQPLTHYSQPINESHSIIENSSDCVSNTVNFLENPFQDMQIPHDSNNIISQNIINNFTIPQSLPQTKIHSRKARAQLQHHNHSQITQSQSIKQTSTWIKIAPPKLPWQTGEAISESQVSDLSKLPFSLLDSPQEFKNFKIPKLPWECSK